MKLCLAGITYVLRRPCLVTRNFDKNFEKTKNLRERKGRVKVKENKKIRIKKNDFLYIILKLFES